MAEKKIKAVIDRIEGDKAVLEVQGTYEIIFPVNLLPEGSNPGNILDFDIVLNPSAEKEQKEKIRKLQEKLKNSVTSHT